MPWVKRHVRARKDVPFDAILDDAAEMYGVDRAGIEVSVSDGHGIHLHGADCGEPVSHCDRSYDESDWLVLVTYQPGRRALYGVLNGIHSLWID